MFNSEIFLFLFLPVVLIIYYLIPKRAKNYWLLIVSLLFYAYNSLAHFWVFLISILFNYFTGLLLNNGDIPIYRKFILIVNIVFNFFLLLFYKYFNFGLSIVNDIFNMELNFLDIILPVGISFYTFQGLSYIIDVYRDKVKVQKNVFKFALYISFFPQLVAGPIVRYDEISEQIENRNTKLDDIVLGIKRFTLGLFKKVVLADSLAIVADKIFGLPSTDLTSSIAWLGIIGYSFQIYFDFSGYSDMAIGLAKMLGFKLPENFNLPYTSKSITEFWRRWHITLSNWFRDYVYIPLGGKKKRQLFNIFIVFLLTGLWHGAGYNFIIWGIWHAVFNILEKILSKVFKDLEFPKWINIFRHVYVVLVVLIGWVFFRTSDINSALVFLRAMFLDTICSNPGFNIGWFLTKYIMFILLICMFLSTPLPRLISNKIKSIVPDNIYNLIENVFILLILFISIMTLVTSNYHSFIYFQF